MSFIQSNDFDNFIDNNVPNLDFYFGNAQNKKKLTTFAFQFYLYNKVGLFNFKMYGKEFSNCRVTG